MHWLSWFRSETFCCVFSLQSGTVVSIMVLSALGITSLVNIIYFLVTTSSFADHIAPFCLAMAYLIILGIGLILAFCGAYSENTFWMVLGSLFTFIAIVIYIVITVLSFLPPMYGLTCFSFRCPEHLWLQESYWRSGENETDTEDEEFGNLTNKGEENLRGSYRITTFALPSTTRLISHRRLRPNPISREYGMEKGSYLVGKDDEEEGVDKEEFLCGKTHRKLADEGDDDDLDYCPEGREGEGDSGIRIYSAITSILYLVFFVGSRPRPMVIACINQAKVDLHLRSNYTAYTDFFVSLTN